MRRQPLKLLANAQSVHGDVDGGTERPQAIEQELTVSLASEHHDSLNAR
jgi:hypothetical protein